MAAEYKDYYKVLGVKRDATQDEIKKAYRRLARKHHPDVHQGKDGASAEAKFKEINEANQVLGDPEARKQYDSLGADWKHGDPFRGFGGAGARDPRGGAGGFRSWSTQGGPQAGGFEGFEGFGEAGGFSDFFQQVFGEGGRGRGRGRGGGRGFSMRGDDAEAVVDVTLEEVLHGTRRSLRMSGLGVCESCRGTGAIEGKPCPTCHGAGQVPQTQTVEVRIPPGIQAGGQLRVRGKGNPGVGGGPPGDLLLRVQVAAHPVLHRIGDDLQVELPLWPWEAVLGKEVSVPVLEGAVKMKVPADSQAGTRMKLRGKGLPGRGGARGDQYVVLKVVIPELSTPEERELYEKLARARPGDPRSIG